MLQECPPLNNPNKHPSEKAPATISTFELRGQLPTLPHMDGSTLTQTLRRYCHLFNNPGLLPSGVASHLRQNIPQPYLLGKSIG